MSNPASPAHIGSYDTPDYARGVSLSSDGRFAYVADGSSGLQIIDVSNQASPTRVGSYDTPSYAHDISLSSDGRFAYVADSSSGLQIIDVSNPAEPTRIGSYDTPSYANDVALSSDGRFAYVADESSGLQIIDVSNPASPTHIGSYDTPSYARGVSLSSDGRFACVADSSSGLQIIDVSNPAEPTRIGSYDTPSWAYDVSLSPDARFAYVADDSSGLQIIDISNPAEPTRIGSYDTPSYANGVSLSSNGRFAYVADRSSGLQIIDVLTGSFSVTSDQVLASNLIISSSEVEEGAAGSVVGIISQVNESVGQSVTYSLTQGGGDTNNSSFVIVGNELRTAKEFNHEFKDLYAVRLKAEESNGTSYELPIIVKITDVNETPFALSLSENLIAENVAAGTLVGTFSAYDEDSNDSFEYTFASGVGDTDNAVFQIVGNELLTKDAIDFETKEQYSVRIRTTDAGGAFY